MTTEIQTTTGEARDLAKMVESLVMRGDISALSPEHRVRFYVQTCEGLGLNPHSQPFAFLKLNGKEVMYATRGATDQLAAMHRIDRKIIDGPRIMDIAGSKVAYCVAEARHPNGRTETATATLPVADPVNLYMKLETKAKRRVTLSILGLGVLDETEIDTIPASVRGEASPVDLTGAVTLLRDDAPSALTTFRLDLADVTDCRSLTACWQSHAQALHAAGDQDTARLDVAARMTALRYALTGAETTALLGGTMHSAYAAALDALTEIERHADDEDGDAVIADVVRVLRAAGDAPSTSKGHIATAAIKRAVALGVADAKARITAALKPPQPPTTPTGTDAPRSTPAASAEGGSVAPSQSAGAQASANDGPRFVADPDEVEARLITSAAAWAEHLARHVEARSPVFTLAGGYHKRRQAFVEAGVHVERYEATLAAIEAREGRGPDAARQALDGYTTRRVMPQGVGEVIRLRSHRQIVAANGALKTAVGQ